MGVCNYTLVKTNDKNLSKNKQFTLIVENEFLNGNTHVSYLKEANFSFYHKILKRDVIVIINRNDGSRGQALVSIFVVASLNII